MRKKIISVLLMGLAFFGLTQSTSAQCTQVSPYSEDFSTYPPTCWTEAQGRLSNLNTLTGTTSDWVADGFLNAGSSGAARMNIWSTTKDEWLISPILDLGTGPTSYQVEFDAGLTDFNGSGTDLMGADDSLAVVISLDSGDTWSSANILKLYTAGNPPSNSGESVVIDLSAYSGKVKIGFYAASTVSNTDYNVYIDNFAFNPLATCPKPTALAVAELTTTSADFYWMENGTATSWQVEFGVSGYTAGTAPKTVYSMDSITLSGLSSNTVYDAYVRAICSSSDSSAWVGPITFRTLCAPFTAPYFNDFEASSTNMAPSCWSSYKTNSGSYAEVRASTPYSGVNAINMYSSGASTSGSDSLILATPQFSDLIAGDKQISFYVRSSSLLNALLIGTVASPDPTATFNPIDTVLFSSTTSYEEVIIPFTTANGYNGTDQYIVLVSNLGSTYTYIRIDDFNYSVIPTCPKPIGLTATAITSSSVSFNWTESGSAASWQIQYDTTGFPIGTGIKNVVALDSVNETGLIPETDYDVYVRSICGSNDSSAWTGPISFRTLCGSLSAPFVENFNSFVPNCWNEAGNGTPNSGITSIGSGDWGSTNYLNSASNGKGAKINLFSNVDKEWIITPTLDLTAGGPLELVISAGVTDYNGSTADNMGADDEVLVLISEDNMLSWDTLLTWNSSNQPPTAGADYRISLAGYTSNNNIVAIWATDGSVSNTEDYDFHIGKFELRTVPSCLAVTANSGTNSLTFNSAEVSWVENGTATSWRVEYDTIGYAAGTARNTIVVTDTFSILTGLSGSTDYDWKVSALCSVNDSSAFVGNSFTTPASCLAPTANSGTNSLTATSAEVSWIESASATSWRVEYDTIGYAAGTARNTVVVTDTFAIITGLTANTDYEWNVSALCSVSDSSTFVGNSFYTGYCQVSTTNTGDYLSSLVSSGANTNISYTATSNAAGSYSDETAQSISSFATGSYDITSTYVGGSNGVNVWVDWNNDLDFDDANELVGSSVGSAASKTISITTPGTAVVGNYRMRVRAQYGSTANPPACGNVSYGTTLDFTLIVSAPPACLAPTAQSLDSLASTAVKVSWLENGNATQWEIEYDTAGFVIGTGRNTVTVNTDTFKVLTGLSANTNYDWYVRAICSPTTQSTYAGSASFFTGYCQVSTTNTGDYISSLVSTGANTNISYTATSNPLGSYADETAQILTSYAAGTFDITSTYVGGSNGVKVWVDWNNDLVFDDVTELIGYQVSTAASKTISGAVPATATIGNYRMRVRAQWGSSANPPSCGNVSYGTTVDLTVSLIAPPLCLGVSGLSSSELTSNSVDLFWTENNTSTSWQLEYDVTGYTQGTGAKSVVVSDSITLGSLSSNTTYDAYVRSICSSTDTSSWVGPITFTTLCAPFSAPYVEDFNTFVPACWEEASTGDLTTGPATLAAGDWRVGDFGNNAANGGGARINLYTNSRTEWLVSPTIDLSNGSYELAIEAAVTNWNTSAPDNMGSDDSVQIVISTDGGLTWTSIYTWDANNQPPTLGQKYSIDLSSYTSANNIFGIYATDGPIDDLEDYDFHIGSFDVRVPPTCPEPIANATSLIGSDSAFVSWVETGAAIQWEVEYGLVGYTVGTGSSIIVNIDTFTTINGLNSNTTYDYYVRAICGSNDTSTWTNSSTFTTSFLSCVLSTATTLPFLEDWENLNDTVTGPANIICNPDYTWHLLSSNPNGRARYGSAAILAAGGTGAITLDAITSSGVIANDLILTLNLAANSSASNLELEFDFAHHGEENHANDSVWIRGSQSDTWVGIYDLFANKGTIGIYNSVGPIDIDARLAAAGQTVSSSFQIRFGQEDDFPATSPTASDGFSFDNISVKLGPLPYYPVGTINTEDATTGIADSLGVFCWTSGTVAGIDLDGNVGLSFTIIDQSGTNPEGINIYNFADVSNYVVTEGDSIMIRGEIQQFNGLTELFPDSIAIISTGAAIPNAAIVTTLDESTESALIRIEDLTVTSVPAGTSINIGLTDGTNNFVMRVDSDTDVLDSLTFTVGDKLCSVNGIGGQFDNSNPYLSGYQIFPMRYTDVVFAPSVDLGPDTIVCDTNNFMLDAGNFASYVWSTGALTRTITPTTANTTYSVVVTDANGCTNTDTVDVTVSVCVGIIEAKQVAASINFFPNPNNGQFKLQIENVTAPNSTLEIVNIQGQIVYNENLIINGSLSKDININVEKGIYFVRLLNKNGVKVEKLIIE